MASKIEDYGLIGNGRTAALVSKTGAIDWLCAPDFDSDACFASLLGYDEHGRWSVRPTVAVREQRQRYRGETLVLETELVCDGGAIRIVDFMPYDGRCDLVRIIEGIEGDPHNVVGISVPLLRELVADLGITWTDLWASR